MAAEDERGTRVSQLSFPGGPGPGGEAGPGEPLPTGPGERTGLRPQPLLQLQPDRGGAPGEEQTAGRTAG